ALAAEVARVGRADDQERDSLRAGHELLGDLGERVSERRARWRLARGIVPFRRDLDVLPQLVADGLAEHLAHPRPVVTRDRADVDVHLGTVGYDIQLHA